MITEQQARWAAGQVDRFIAGRWREDDWQEISSRALVAGTILAGYETARLADLLTEIKTAIDEDTAEL